VFLFNKSMNGYVGAYKELNYKINVYLRQYFHVVNEMFNN